MDIIEIDSGGTIQRRQSIPEDWTVEDGVVISAAGHRVFPTTTRWYAAPGAGAVDGGTYNPETGVASPPPDPRRQYTLVEYKQRQQPALKEAATNAFNDKWSAFDIYSAARQATTDRSQIDSDAQALKTEFARVRQAVIDATSYDEVDAAVASANFAL